MMAYTIAAAKRSGVFGAIYVSTDSHEYAQIARDYGAESIMRPVQIAGDLDPDFLWVEHALSVVALPHAFAILRPTSPLRQPETIQRAWKQFDGAGFDSLRAVEPCKQHPNKMWVARKDGSIWPYVPHSVTNDQPSHSVPYQLLPRVFAQNASLEIAWSRVVTKDRNISGAKVMPFWTEGWEGLDINGDADFLLLETLLDRGLAKLPEV